MIDNLLIIFTCQVLEYQPEPSNQWTRVGQIETKRANHAVLSIGCEALLSSLPGYLELDDLIVRLSYHHPYQHYQQHHHYPTCQNKS